MASPLGDGSAYSASWFQHIHFGILVSIINQFSTMTQETYRPAFARDKSQEFASYISYGLTYPEACVKHVSETFHAARVYILASGSLSRNTDAVDRLIHKLDQDLGERTVVGVKNGIRSHTYFSDVLDIVNKSKDCDADCLVTLGAGSLTDAAKVVSLALANNATDWDELGTLHSDSPTYRKMLKPAKVPIICIPTSLSAGEYTSFAGATDDKTHHKHPFAHTSMGPRLVILDPVLSKTTPERIWLSTGVRSVDHCVEAICSIKATAEGDQAAENGLRQLLPGLLKTKEEPGLTEPRLQCQLGAVDAVSAVLQGIPLGASHGIGHQLGGLGVGHGETSCIMLPAVCKWNKRINSTQQQKVLDILWHEPSSKVVLQRHLEQDKNDLGDALDVIFRELGMPRSLKEVGVGSDKLDALATGSLQDRWCKTNSIPLEAKEQVMDILQLVIGDQ